MNGNVNLIALERWLDSCVQKCFNALANIVAIDEKQKTNNERNNKLIVNLTKMDSDINENLSDNLCLKCWFCKNNHWLMDCPGFKNGNISEKRQFAKENKLCFNCLSKTHIVKDCKLSFKCTKRTVTKNIRFCMNHLMSM